MCRFTIIIIVVKVTFFNMGGAAMKKGEAAKIGAAAKKLKGFTIVELIVVMAILAALAAIIVPMLYTYVDNARIARTKANARHVYGAASYAIADCVAGSSAGVILPDTVYTGSDADLIAYAAGGGQFAMTNYLGGDFTGYFAFMVDPSGSGCTYALWSASPIAAADAVLLSDQDVKDSKATGLVASYPVKEDDP